jgi:hypothetical protein
MPWNDSDIAALRMAYNVAVTAHGDCSRAVTAALVRGEAASTELIEAEAAARRLREEARRKLHAAMASALGPPPEPPTPSR